MKLGVNKNVALLSLAFLFIVLGFNSVQQYVTTYFTQLGAPGVGFTSLLLLYFFLLISNPISTLLISRYGPKKMMALGAVTYAVYVGSVATSTPILVYMASVLLGFGASMLLIGQNVYLIKLSNKENYGKSAGFFTTIRAIGSTFGLLALGFLIARYSYMLPFSVFVIFPLIGVMVLLSLKPVAGKPKAPAIRLVRKAIRSATVLQLALISFSTYFIYGLAIGRIPVQVKDVLGVTYVGALGALFYLTPILFAYFIGRGSDKVGRKKMIFYSYIAAILGLVLIYQPAVAVLLVAGIALLALNYAGMSSMIMALVGDVTTKKNIEPVTGLFLMAQSAGVVLALFLSSALSQSSLYITSIVTMVLAFVIVLFLFRYDLKKIKARLSHEVK